ncbi:unnamed protein product [Laminaria digitata]
MLCFGRRCCPRAQLYSSRCVRRRCLPRGRLRSRFIRDLAACHRSCGSLRHRRRTRTNIIGFGARTPLQNVRDSGMTHAYDGLSRSLPYVVLKPGEFAADSPNELVDSISCFC